MEYCPRRLGAISQLFSEPVPDTKVADWHRVQRAEVICPKPCRAVRVPCLIDGLNRYNCKTKSLNAHRDDGLDILDFILGKDEQYDNPDPETSGQGSILCRSPPVRSSNPLAHDPEFDKQSLSAASPRGNYYCGKHSPRVEKTIPSRGTSYSGSPKVRVEGFASGSPEYHSVVSARA